MKVTAVAGLCLAAVPQAALGGFLSVVGYGERALDREAIHWATGGWNDWDTQSHLVRSDDIHKSIEEQMRDERNAVTHAGLVASIELLGVQDAVLNTEQQQALKQSIGRVLRWPANKIVDVQIADNHHCDRVTLSMTTKAEDGTTLPAGFGDRRLGDYFRVPSVSTRPVFRQEGEDGWYLYFGAETNHMSDTGNAYTTTKRWWVVGPKLGGTQAGLIAPDDVRGPEEVRKGGWYSFEHAGGWKLQPGISVRCNPVKRTTIKFRAATTLCNAAEIKVLKRLPARLASGVYTLRNDLRFAGVATDSLKQISIKQMRLASCNPKIFLALASAQKARVMQAEAAAECNRRMSHESMKHWGCDMHQVYHDMGNHITKNVFGTVKGDTRPPTPAPTPAPPTPAPPTPAPTSAAPTTAPPTAGPWHLRARHVAAAPTQLDCVVGMWMTASHCSVTCGIGVARFRREVLSDPTGRGAPCPALAETRECRLLRCASELSPVGVTDRGDASSSQIAALLGGTPDTGVELTPTGV